MVVTLKQLNELLADIYASSPIVYNYAVQVLEQKQYDSSQLELRDLLRDIDNVFPIDKLSPYDKVLASIDCTPQGKTKFNLKFNIVNGP